MNIADTNARPTRLLWAGDRFPDRLRELAQAAPQGPLRWQAADRGRWQAQLQLGPVAAGSYCIPSLLPGRSPIRASQMHLHWETGASLSLAAMSPGQHDPSWPQADWGTVGPAGAQARAELDCLEVFDPLPAVTLTLEVAADVPPRDCALLVSLRQRLLPAVTDSGILTDTLDVPSRSQMQLPAEIARQTCSPVSVAMVMAQLGVTVSLAEFAHSCRHPRHPLFGIWPHNLAMARQLGVDGMVRAFDSLDDAARVLRAGHPVIASVRFAKGDLPGAPLPGTAGHLMVLRGLGANQVCVNDPAAGEDAAVTRAYPREAFARAWLADRGVGYVLWNAEVGKERSR